MSKLTAKDRGLIKGAIRRVFSRSEVRNNILEKSKVEGVFLPSRPRVKNWYQCYICDELYIKTEMQVDHIKPVIPLDKTLETMSWDELIKNIWESDAKACCVTCHRAKNKEERKLRKTNVKK